MLSLHWPSSPLYHGRKLSSAMPSPNGRAYRCLRQPVLNALRRRPDEPFRRQYSSFRSHSRYSLRRVREGKFVSPKSRPRASKYRKLVQFPVDREPEKLSRHRQALASKAPPSSAHPTSAHPSFLSMSNILVHSIRAAKSDRPEWKSIYPPPRQFDNRSNAGLQQHHQASFLTVSGHRNHRIGSETRAFRLAWILARYTLPSADPETFKLGPENSQLLRQTGYTMKDVKVWKAIMLAGDAEAAARKLGASRTCPQFLFLIVLKRRDQTPKSLRLLLQHANNQIRHPDDSSELNPIAAINTLEKVGLVVVRLASHARNVLPSSLPAIAKLLQGRFDGDGAEQPPQRRLWLNKYFNSLLVEFSRRISRNPFMNSEYAARGQYEILRKMAEYEPQLFLDRRALRALIITHQALRKTEVERQWAEMKRLSWPPWKTERTGLDADFGFEDGISRSHMLIRQLEAAGYPSLGWEVAGRIRSGWDMNFFPTYQTRHLGDWRERTGVKTTLRNLKFPTERSKAREFDQIWTAKIQSTRTALESWKLFKVYYNRRRPISSLSHHVYFAMIRKLVSERKRLGFLDKNSPRGSEGQSVPDVQPHPELLPGDSSSTLPPEHSLRHTALPTLMQVIQLMRKRAVQLSDSQVAELAVAASDLESGIAVLRYEFTPDLEKPKMSEKMQHLNRSIISNNITEDLLNSIPNSYISALIAIFCRFKNTFVSNLKSRADRDKDVQIITDHDYNRQRGTIELQGGNFKLKDAGFSCALKLLMHWKPRASSPWKNVLRQLGSDGLEISTAKTATPLFRQCHSNLLSFSIMKRVLLLMRTEKIPLDSNFFPLISAAYMKALYSAKLIRLFSTPEAKAHLSMSWQDLSKMEIDATKTIERSFFYLHAAFVELTGQSYRDPPPTQASSNALSFGYTIDSLVQVPSLAALHSMFRALGAQGNWDEILLLLKWTKRHLPAINETAEVELRETRVEELKRRIAVCIRSFLDIQRSPLLDDDSPFRLNVPGLWQTADEQTYQQIKQEVESLDGFGGWPSAMEIREYCSSSKPTRNHRRIVVRIDWAFNGKGENGVEQVRAEEQLPRQDDQLRPFRLLDNLV